ncbi:MAG: chemotaxis protein CheA, partial [Silvanigrellaceae bacterium]|nr:chemotaxis protein CheA [Silvanigrellaceae bacterium]
DIHTIKGSAQLFGFSKMGNIAHIMESCLDPLRKEKIKLSQKLLDSIYIGIDFIIFSLENVKKSKKEATKDEQLNNLFKKFISSVEEIFTNSNDLTKDKEFVSEEIMIPEDCKNLMKETKIVTSEINKENLGFGIFDDIVKPSISESTSIPSKTVEVKKTSLSSSKIIENENKKSEDLSNSQEIKKSTTDDSFNETIRVQVGLLNSLMNLVGELVLIRNQLLEHAKSNDEDPEFLKMSQRLNILTAELQNEVMKTRMQPIGNILTVYSRVVRDLSRELGKKIELQLIGIETELDKTVIEAVKDPLMHIVRNAIDHGIENSEDRKKAGKKETALIQIKAYNENGQVIIEIIDDGRGLDLKRISEKAVEKGILTSEQVAKLSEKEIQLLIFSPGFSTAASISNISGRGVGMDVVKTNVEKIGGVFDLLSTFGLGTTIMIKIPLSLAILPALIVKSHSQRFAIPQTKLVELLRIDGTENTSEKIEPLQGNMVFRLRGKLIPIISLSEVLFGKKLNISFINENV